MNLLYLNILSGHVNSILGVIIKHTKFKMISLSKYFETQEGVNRALKATQTSQVNYLKKWPRSSCCSLSKMNGTQARMDVSPHQAKMGLTCVMICIQMDLRNWTCTYYWAK